MALIAALIFALVTIGIQVDNANDPQGPPVEAACRVQFETDVGPSFVRGAAIVTDSRTDDKIRAFQLDTCLYLWEIDKEGMHLAGRRGDSEYFLLVNPELAETTIRAFDIRTGKPLWRASTDFGVNRVEIKGEYLVAAGEGGIARLDPQTGETIWRRSSKLGHYPELSISEKHVYVTHKPIEDWQLGLTVFESIDIETGLTDWSIDLEPQALVEVQAFDDGTGQIMVNQFFPSDPNLETTAYVDSDRTLYESALYRIDSTTGGFVWVQQFSGGVHEKLQDGVLVVANNAYPEFALIGLDPLTGEILWTNGLESGLRIVAGQDGQVTIELERQVGDQTRYLLKAFRTADGAFVWSTDIPGQVIEETGQTESDAWRLYFWSDRIVIQDVITGRAAIDSPFPRETSVPEFNDCNVDYEHYMYFSLTEDYVVLSCGFGFTVIEWR